MTEVWTTNDTEATVTGRSPVPFAKKMNPLWWLVGPDGWNVPLYNNGQPYLPDVRNVWLRRFYWFACRNPLMNFVGFVLGVEDRNYKVYGSHNVLCNTGRDCSPREHGFRWSVIFPKFSPVALGVGLLYAALYWFILRSPLFPVIAAWALLKTAGPLPFVSYYNGKLEFYTGWRPSSGGFGSKLVFRAD